MEKLLCFITGVKDRILGGEAEWVSGIFAVAQLRTGLRLVNNITEHLCSPEKDVRSFLPSTGCSQLCHLRAVEVPNYLRNVMECTRLSEETTQRRLQQVLNPRRQRKESSSFTCSYSCTRGHLEPMRKDPDQNRENNLRGKKTLPNQFYFQLQCRLTEYTESQCAPE